MKLYFLDGSKLSTGDEAYLYLEKRLDFPSYFGHNLDALWDLISERREEVYIFYRADYMDEDIRDVFTDSHHTVIFDDELQEEIALVLKEDDHSLLIEGEDQDTAILSFRGIKTSLGLVADECLITSDGALLALIKALELKGPSKLLVESEALKKAILERDRFIESKGLFGITK